MDSLPSDEDMLSVGASKRADGGKRGRVTKGLEVVLASGAAVTV